jgi:hypothetical protein
LVLEMQGGKKVLLVNSSNLCEWETWAVVKVGGQNGRLRELRSKIGTSCKIRGGRSR